MGDLTDNQLIAGTALAIFGTILALFFHFILQIVPLTALGIAAIILGTTIAITSPQPLPKETIQLLINNTIQNIEALLEEFTTIEKAIYIPKEEKIYAYIPLNPTEIDTNQIKKTPNRLIVKVGEHYGLQLIPPATELIKTLNLESPEEINIEDTLRTILVDLTDLAEGVKTVFKNNTIIIEITGIKLEIDAPRYIEILGSLQASIAATTIAAVLKKPVKILEEKPEKNKTTIKVQILGG